MLDVGITHPTIDSSINTLSSEERAAKDVARAAEIQHCVTVLQYSTALPSIHVCILAFEYITAVLCHSSVTPLSLSVILLSVSVWLCSSLSDLCSALFNLCNKVLGLCNTL